MFGRWWRKQVKPLSGVALPDLDREASALWGRGPAPPLATPPADSLDFGPAGRPRRTHERARRRRRLLGSLLLGLILGTVLTVGASYVALRVRPSLGATSGFGECMTFGSQDQEEIYYSDDVSAEQARRLGAFLRREGIFGDAQPKSVRLSREGGVFFVGFALEWNSWQDEGIADDFRDLLPRLSRGAFDGAPVAIHLCARQPDSKGRMLPTMRVIGPDGVR